jgi:hypothetical protein
MRYEIQGLTGQSPSGGSGVSSTKQLSAREVVCWWIAVFIICITFVALVAPFPTDGNYSLISAAIRHRDFKHLPDDQPREFWGISYASALISSITRVSDPVALVALGFCSSVIAVLICYRLWGGTVAIWFALVNWWWLDSTVFGGSEPPFMALLLGSFLAVRKERWMLGALLASLATIVRPVGILALVAIAVVLLVRRDIREFIGSAAIGLAVGISYAIPMILIYGDPFAGVRSYQHQDWASALPVSIPFLPLIKGVQATAVTMRLPLKVLVGSWLVLTVAGLLQMILDKSFREYARQHRVEAIFACLYAILLVSYNANFWAWQHFPRFAIPLLPFLLLASLRHLSTNKTLLCGIAVASIVCVVLPRAGIENVSRVVHNLVGR